MRSVRDIKKEPKRSSAGKGEKRIRLLLVLFIVIGLGYSIYSMFHKENVYVSIQTMINDNKFSQVENLTKKLIKHNALDVRTMMLMGKNYFFKAIKEDHVKNDQTEEGWELYKKAIKCLRKAELLDKKNLLNSESFMIIGFSYMKQGDSYFNSAMRYFIQAETKNKTDKVLTEHEEKIFSINSLYKLIGLLKFKTGKYKDAIKYYTMANVKKEVLNYVYIGRSQKYLKKYDLAIKTFKTVYDYANLKRLKQESLKNLGWLYFHSGETARSRSIFLKCTASQTNYAEGYYWLGKIEERKGDQRKAEDYWKKSLAADSHFGPAILKIRNLKGKRK